VTGAAAAVLFAAGFEPGASYIKLPRCSSCKHWENHGALRDVGVCGLLTGGYSWGDRGVVGSAERIVTTVHTQAGFGCVQFEARDAAAGA